MAEEGYSAEQLPTEQMLRAMQGLIKMAKIYQANNQLLVNVMQQLVSAVKTLLVGNEWLLIHLENGRFFINDEKVLRRKVSAVLIDSFYNYLTDRRIPGFRIMPAIATASAGEFIGFAKLLDSCAEQADPAEWLETRLMEKGSAGFPFSRWMRILKNAKSV